MWEEPIGIVLICVFIFVLMMIIVGGIITIVVLTREVGCKTLGELGENCLDYKRLIPYYMKDVVRIDRVHPGSLEYSNFSEPKKVRGANGLYYWYVTVDVNTDKRTMKQYGFHIANGIVHRSTLITGYRVDGIAYAYDVWSYKDE